MPGGAVAEASWLGGQVVRQRRSFEDLTHPCPIVLHDSTKGLGNFRRGRLTPRATSRRVAKSTVSPEALEFAPFEITFVSGLPG
jgi:hypothetical protein